MTTAGLTALIASHAYALTGIKIAGGLYLLWLGYQALRAAASTREIKAIPLAIGTRSRIGCFARGFGVAMTNPKDLLGWIAIISLGLQENAPLWVGVAIVGGTTILSVVIYWLAAAAFSTPLMVRLYTKARRWIQGALGVFFAVAGIKLLVSR